MYRRLALLAVGLALLCTMPLAAQDVALSQTYGSGVHAFFSQEYRQAYDYLTAAVDAGTPDPRCYYFRGLTYLQLGREEEAKMDFEEAARLEAEDINEFYNVGRALERVQGKVRLMVEQYRAEARLEAMRRAEELRKKRYGELREAEQRVLETQAAAAPATPLEVPAAPQPATIEDPFGVGPAQPAPAMTEPAETPAPATQEAPVSEVPAPAGTDQDPFATRPAQQPPAAEPAGADVPPGTTASGVLGAIGKAVDKAIIGGEEGDTAAPSDDPFAPAGAPGAAQPVMPGAAQPAAPGADPFAPAPGGAQPAAPADDPFGAGPAAAQPAMPGAAQPAAPGADPFAPAPGGAQPAAPADDPFAPAMAPGAGQPAAPDAAGSPFMEEEQPGAGAAAAPASDDPFAQDPANP